MGEEKKQPDPPGWIERSLTSLGLGPKQAKQAQWVAVALFIGILFLSAPSLFGLQTGVGSSEKPSGSTLVTSPPSPGDEDELTRLERRIAADLEQNLSFIRGAGAVRVLVTLEAGPSIDVVKNTSVDQSNTTEKASDNSTRQTQSTGTKNDHVFYRDGNAERPVIAKTSRPEIAGVLIVAEGARDAKIRALLQEAAVVALKLPANRIQVVPADRGK